MSTLEDVVDAMKARRRELIAQPLDRIWPELAKAALAASPGPEVWQPIETAPKDGTEVIGIFVQQYEGFDTTTVYGPWTVAFRHGKWASSWDGSRVIEYQGDWGTDYKSPDLDPTHWRPLPSPPTT